MSETTKAATATGGAASPSLSQTLAADAKTAVASLESAAATEAATLITGGESALLGNAQPAAIPSPAAGASLSAAEQAAAADLANTVAKLTGQTSAQVLPFATRFAPDAVRWAALLAEYQATGNHALYVTQANNLRALRDGIILQAADLGVNLQAGAEETLIDAVQNFATAAVAALAKAAV